MRSTGDVYYNEQSGSILFSWERNELKAVEGSWRVRFFNDLTRESLLRNNNHFGSTQLTQQYRSPCFLFSRDDVFS